MIGLYFTGQPQKKFPMLVQLGYVNAYAGITLPNPKSVGLHEALGFTPVGIYRNVGFKLGAWHDVGWWQRPLRQYADNPSPPTSMEDYAADRPNREMG